MQRLYKISLETYNSMYAAQGGCCAICKKHQSELKRTLSVDHCHRTGRVRALLCGNCNKGIGNLQDDPALVTAALSYLVEHMAKEGDPKK